MIGEVVLDEIVWAGRPATIRRLGGGALYAAVGALLWGARPEVHATVGDDVAEADLARLRLAGIGLESLTRIPGPGLGLWMLYEESGLRQQVEKLGSPSMLTLDMARRSGKDSGPYDGAHVAPQTTEGQLRALEMARGAAAVTLDCMVEPYIDRRPYRDGSALRGVTAFLPSAAEVSAVWGDVEPTRLAASLRDQAGVRWLVITRGADGSDVVEPERITWVPSVPVAEVDPTGAGDAYCGGFLAGLLDDGDPIKAAARGATSASFVVETQGVIDAVASLDRREAERRLGWVLDRVGVAATRAASN